MTFARHFIRHCCTGFLWIAMVMSVLFSLTGDDDTVTNLQSSVDILCSSEPDLPISSAVISSSNRKAHCQVHVRRIEPIVSAPFIFIRTRCSTEEKNSFYTPVRTWKLLHNSNPSRAGPVQKNNGDIGSNRQQHLERRNLS